MLMNAHLGEDLPRGGGSGVTCQFRGGSDLFHPLSLYGLVPTVGCREVQGSRVKASRESWSLAVSAWELRAKFVRKLRYPPNKFKGWEEERSFTSFYVCP